MVCVQAVGCAPIVRAYDHGTERTEFWQNDETLAACLRVPAPFADRLILWAPREGHGAAVAVIDEEIGLAQKELVCVEGLVAAPEGAAAWAALKSPVRAGWIQPDERQVLFNPGSGLKYL